METRANYVLIGVFTLAVIVGAFGFVWWFQRLGDTGTRVAYEVVYEGAVSGLRTGSTVLFNGIRVGEVASVTFDRDDPRKVVATIAVSSTTPIRTDTKASLEFQGLTGIASVSLIGGSPTAPPLKGVDGKLPRLMADSAGLQDLMQGAKNVLVRVESIAVRVDQLIEANQKKLDEIISNVAVFSKDMAGKDGRSLALEVTDTAKEITAAAKSVRELAEHLDKTIGPAVKEYHQLAQDARKTVAEATRVLRELERNPSQILFGRRTTPAPTDATTTGPTFPLGTTQPRQTPARTTTQKQKQQ